MKKRGERHFFFARYSTPVDLLTIASTSGNTFIQVLPVLLLFFVVVMKRESRFLFLLLLDNMALRYTNNTPNLIKNNLRTNRMSWL